MGVRTTFTPVAAQPMQSIHPQPSASRNKPAFTLVEMLVVVAIITILMTAGSIGLSSMAGRGVTSGVATAESLFDEARATAVGRNIRACVLVAKTLTNNPADDLRRILVAYEPVDANGLPTTASGGTPAWILSSRGAVLPDQTYFSSTLSKKDINSGGTLDVVTLTNAKTAYAGDYYIYEFNDQGICKTPGASFIIGAGARNASQSATAAPPRVTASAKHDFGGFVVWRNGRTSVFRSPEQMGTSITSLTSGDKF